ncbi:MAG: hypothetical protein ACLUE6_05935 [Acutalibacteraceae bacterium]
MANTFPNAVRACRFYAATAAECTTAQNTSDTDKHTSVQQFYFAVNAFIRH